MAHGPHGPMAQCNRMISDKKCDYQVPRIQRGLVNELNTKQGGCHQAAATKMTRGALRHLLPCRHFEWFYGSRSPAAGGSCCPVDCACSLAAVAGGGLRLPGARCCPGPLFLGGRAGQRCLARRCAARCRPLSTTTPKMTTTRRRRRRAESTLFPCGWAVRAAGRCFSAGCGSGSPRLCAPETSKLVHKRQPDIERALNIQ